MIKTAVAQPKKVEVRDTSNRRQRVSAMLRDQGSVQVQTLAEMFQVTTQTIRKDLLFLERRGVATRSYGGAISAQAVGITPEAGVEAKKLNRASEKERIGRMAAALVEPGDSIVLDSGTTTAQIARFLPDTDEITVVTNDFGVLQELVQKSKLNIIMLGGALRRKNMAFYGSLTETAMAGLLVDKFFLGVDGYHLEHGITTHYESEAHLNRMMAKMASQVIAVTDGSKFGKRCLHRVIGLNDIDVLITDSGAPQAMLDTTASVGAKLMTA
ncbi:MAG: transcriptional repressor AgaR [Terricaulis sp.]